MLEKSRILIGKISINDDGISTQWDEIFFISEQLSYLQGLLIKNYPQLNAVSAASIILKYRCSTKQNEGLIFFIEDTMNLGIEDGSISDQRILVSFLRELQRYNKIGQKHNWCYDKMKSVIFGISSLKCTN
ncbi:MAG: hypothetical protein ACLQQ4_08010 [Bacteroidia bacterium]